MCLDSRVWKIHAVVERNETQSHLSRCEGSWLVRTSLWLYAVKIKSVTVLRCRNEWSGGVWKRSCVTTYSLTEYQGRSCTLDYNHSQHGQVDWFMLSLSVFVMNHWLKWSHYKSLYDIRNSVWAKALPSIKWLLTCTRLCRRKGSI